jgi:hypothetical protein
MRTMTGVAIDVLLSPGVIAFVAGIVLVAANLVI